MSLNKKMGDRHEADLVEMLGGRKTRGRRRQYPADLVRLVPFPMPHACRERDDAESDVRMAMCAEALFAFVAGGEKAQRRAFGTVRQDSDMFHRHRHRTSPFAVAP